MLSVATGRTWAYKSDGGSAMRVMRESCRWTRAEVAEAVGISPSYLGKIETGARELPDYAPLYWRLINFFAKPPERLRSAARARLAADRPACVCDCHPDSVSA